MTSKSEQRMRLSASDLREAIEKAGYPFEIEVFHEFRRAGASPTHGFRTMVGETSVDIDVMATFQELVTEGHTVAAVSVRSKVEAKVFNPPKEFIGFHSVEWNDHARRVARFRVSGSPSWNVLTDGGTVPEWAQRSWSSVDLLNQRPWCAQWGVFEHAQEGRGTAKPRVHHPPGLWQSVAGLIRAAHAMDFEASRTLPWQTQSLNLSVRLSVPALVIDVPCLYVYDATTRELAETDWLTLCLMIDLGERHQSRVIDVVCRRGLPTYIDALRGTSKQFGLAVREGFHGVRQAAETARDEQRTIHVPSRRR